MEYEQVIRLKISEPELDRFLEEVALLQEEEDELDNDATRAFPAEDAYLEELERMREELEEVVIGKPSQ